MSQHLTSSRPRPALIATAATLLAVSLWVALAPAAHGAEKDATAAPGATAPSAGKPALTVTTTTALPEAWPLRLAANGSIAAWQEALVGAEAAGLRITSVKVNVGDRVKRGQALAALSAASVEADLAATRAALAEAKAAAAEAEANATRARELKGSGAISAQQIQQYLTAETSAQARVQAQRARLKSDKLRLSQTRVLAPDDGIVSARSATVGAVTQPGQELFRLIRGGRLEWRAEVTAAELPLVQPGQSVTLQAPDGSTVTGTVRMVAPTVDAATRNGLVYVDLQAGGAARAGMFSRGSLAIGQTQALTLPQSAVMQRDGFNYAFRVGADGRVVQTKISVGRRVGDRMEITGGLNEKTPVVASGVGFLADGDLVRVVARVAGPQAAATVQK